MKNVYLDVTEVEDLFDIDDLIPRITSSTSVTYILHLGIECIIKEELLDTLEDVDFIDDECEVFDQITAISTVVEEIVSGLEDRKKVYYDDFVRDIINHINDTAHLGEDVDIDPMIDEDVVRHVINDLKRLGLIRKKGKKLGIAR